MFEGQDTQLPLIKKGVLAGQAISCGPAVVMLPIVKLEATGLLAFALRFAQVPLLEFKRVPLGQLAHLPLVWLK